MLNTNKIAPCQVSLAAVYSPVPRDLDILNVLVIHRHGDRAQLSKTLGSKYPISEKVTSIWNSLLPTERTRRAMLLAADPAEEMIVIDDQIDLHATLYAGWDNVHYPYAQLTEVGANQMIEVGKELRKRYLCSDVFPTAQVEDLHRSIYCRSTTMCRTSQSLRCLLVGLCDIDPDQLGEENIRPVKLRGLPRIIKRPFEEETLFPQGGSSAMIERRNVIYPPELIRNSIPEYVKFESRVKDTLGLPGKVNWATVMEVLHCHSVHNIKHFDDCITPADIEKATEIAAWHWGVLYQVSVLHFWTQPFQWPTSFCVSVSNCSFLHNRQDKILNKLAIGRFLWDMMVDLRCAMGDATAAGLSRTGPSTAAAERDSTVNKTMLIYSGHDSTLVPVLYALGVQDGELLKYDSYFCVVLFYSAIFMIL